MKRWLVIVFLAAAFASPATLKADLWVGGHGDIGIGLVGNTLDLHLHFADAVDKEGTLHSGKGGKVVKNPKQAMAIAISEAAKSARYKKSLRMLC